MVTHATSERDVLSHWRYLYSDRGVYSNRELLQVANDYSDACANAHKKENAPCKQSKNG